MSWTRQFVLWCDECSDWVTLDCKKVGTIRKHYKMKGWDYKRGGVYKGGKDLCPYCLSKIQDKKEEES